MIIACESCRARFNVPDDKVKEGGTRVRCSKCGQVFTATKPADGLKTAGVNIGAGSGALNAKADPFAAAGAAANPSFDSTPPAANPSFDSTPPAANPSFDSTPPAAADPFAAAGAAANPSFGSTPPAAADPFAAPGAAANPSFDSTPPAAADPFAAPGAAANPSFDSTPPAAADPFAAPDAAAEGAADPFAVASPSPSPPPPPPDDSDPFGVPVSSASPADPFGVPGVSTPGAADVAPGMDPFGALDVDASNVDNASGLDPFAGMEMEDNKSGAVSLADLNSAGSGAFDATPSSISGPGGGELSEPTPPPQPKSNVFDPSSADALFSEIDSMAPPEARQSLQAETRVYSIPQELVEKSKETHEPEPSLKKEENRKHHKMLKFIGLAWSVLWQISLLGVFLVAAVVWARGGSVDDVKKGHLMRVILHGGANGAEGILGVAEVRVARLPVPANPNLVVVTGTITNTSEFDFAGVVVTASLSSKGEKSSTPAGGIYDLSALYAAANSAQLKKLEASGGSIVPAHGSVDFEVLLLDGTDGDEVSLSVSAGEKTTEGQKGLAAEKAAVLQQDSTKNGANNAGKSEKANLSSSKSGSDERKATSQRALEAKKEKEEEVAAKKSKSKKRRKAKRKRKPKPIVEDDEVE
ncbi:MAG: hypothetical protein GY822_29440 [Deltaproteobacteria bacterium]|nr:hypothetical protein [Deltaproteobacteria bacterium]